MIGEHPIQDFLANADRRVVALVLGSALAVVSALIGVSLAFIGPIYTLGVLIALAGGVWMFAGVRNAMISIVLIIALLPYATLPFEIILTPTFLDIAMGAFFFLYIGEWMTGYRRRLIVTPVHALIVMFMLLGLLSFVAGLANAPLTPTILRQFAEMLLSITFAMVLVDVLRTTDDLKMVICLHIGSSSAVKLPTVEAPFTTMLNLQPTAVMDTAADLLWSRVIRLFPNIRFALSEGSIGWIPYLLERADYVYEHHNRWTGSDFGGRLPSEVFRDHFIACFITDSAGLRMLDLIGPEIVCVETDYPHSDSTWPESAERLAGQLEHLPRETIDAITHGNAIRLFGFDPFAHYAPEDCTVGALRAKAGHVDVGPVEPRAPFVAPERPLTLLDMLSRAEHPLLDKQAADEGVAAEQESA